MGNAELVFVYGRLRTGFWNQFLLRRARLMGAARTVNNYALYASAMPYVRMDQAICPVHGEVYAVNAKILRDLDSLMAHPTWYRRCQVPLRLDDDREITAWMYARRGTTGALVETGDLSDRTVAIAASDQE